MEAGLREDRRASRIHRVCLALVCLLGGLRVGFFAAAFPVFTNVDERAHVDVVVKYAEARRTRRENEHFSLATSRLIQRYASPEYSAREAPVRPILPRLVRSGGGVRTVIDEENEG